MIKKLFVVLARPYAEYANIVWHPRFQKEVVKLENVQRSATKMVIGFVNISYKKKPF